MRVMTRISDLLWTAALAVALLAPHVSVPAAHAIAPGGACCFPDLGCENFDEFTCTINGGEFIGGNVTCASIQCTHVKAPVASILGLVGIMGGLVGVGTYRLIRRRRKTA